MSDGNWESQVRLINEDIAELAEFVSRHCELNKASEGYAKSFADHARNRNKTLSSVKPYESKEQFESGADAFGIRDVTLEIDPRPVFAMPLIHPFPRKHIARAEWLLAQPKKIAEEACELIEALANTPYVPNRRVEDEWADCVMALVNFAVAANQIGQGKFDVKAAIERCEKRQMERGRYDE